MWPTRSRDGGLSWQVAPIEMCPHLLIEFVHRICHNGHRQSTTMKPVAACRGCSAHGQASRRPSHAGDPGNLNCGGAWNDLCGACSTSIYQLRMKVRGSRSRTCGWPDRGCHNRYGASMSEFDRRTFLASLGGTGALRGGSIVAPGDRLCAGGSRSGAGLSAPTGWRGRPRPPRARLVPRASGPRDLHGRVRAGLSSRRCERFPHRRRA